MSNKRNTICGPYSVRQRLTNFMLVAILLLVVNVVKAEELSNKYCPVTTSELAEEQFSVDYQGQTIYFCCNKCKKDFLNNPETYTANLESGVADSDQEVSSIDHEDGAHDHEENGKETDLASSNHENDVSHDHETDHGESSSLIGFAGKFHPMMTHFPIALVLSALLFMILAAILRNQTMNYVSVYSIYLAALTGIGTVLLGLAAGSAANYPSFLTGYLDWHRLLGISTGIVTILTAYAGRRFLQQSSKGTVWSYRIAIIVNAILVSVTGHLGASLVFGPDYFNF
ncbi:MAG: YHS domain-containing protein [bacterium]|nr:YHS domain-containing protein [bacterium]MDT8302358.1 DUF2231 domain-containing protein [Sedimentisphaerales bacterium]